MLGRLSIMLTFMHSFRAYLIRRYPTNKLPLTGMIFSSSLVAFIAYRMWLNVRIQKLRSERTGRCPCKKLGLI